MTSAMPSLPSLESSLHSRCIRFARYAVIFILLLAGAGCTSIIVPNAAFTVSVSEGIAPLSVQFDASNSTAPNGEIVLYRWFFGDGERALGIIAEHVYSKEGTYEVVLEIMDEDGTICRARSSIRVHVDSTIPPDAISYGDYVLCQDPKALYPRVGEVLWARPTHARVRVFPGGHGETAWEMDYPLNSLVKLSDKQTEDINSVPDDYYTRNDYGALGLEISLEGLDTFLTNFRFDRKFLGQYHDPNLGSYFGDDEFTEYEVFEAPQMAAALECALEDAGFDALLVVGPSPSIGHIELHAWVIVILPGQILAIEPTEQSLQPQSHDAIVIAPELSLCPYYTHPENEIFYDIYIAIVRYSAEMFEWWPEKEEEG